MIRDMENMEVKACARIGNGENLIVRYSTKETRTTMFRFLNVSRLQNVNEWK